MLPYFPFTEKFDLKIGTSPLPGVESLIEVDQHYLKEVSVKRNLLKAHPDYYFQANAETSAYQWEVVEVILNSLIKTSPSSFILTKNQNNWTFENNLLNEKFSFRFGEDDSLPLAPLDWIGRQIQEDLLILNKDLILIAGQLCFPSGWDLNGKMNKNFFAIHGPLPSVSNSMIETANKFIERIPQGKTFQRNNWGFRISDQLDLSARHSADYRKQLQEISSEMNDENAGEKIFIRVEHQTLSRLPQSGFVLFTIHTYQNKLSDELKNSTKAKILHSFLNGVPQPLLDYKVMTPFVPTLLSYLQKKIH